MQWSRKLGLGASFSEVKLIASDAAESDRLGHSIAVAGNTLVVSSINVDFAAGAAYVFQRDESGGDDWVEVKKLMASDSAPGARLGQSVGISGNTVVVGADGDADMGDDSGSAYLFERNFGGSDNWGEVKKIQAWDPGELEYFGRSVSVSADRAVASSLPSSVHLFDRKEGGAGNWGQIAELSASGVVECTVLDGAVSISGSTIAMGARCNSAAGYKAGAAYVYTPVTTSLPTMPVSGLALLGALVLVSGVGAHRALAGRRSLATSRGTGSVGRLARQGTTSRPR
jgi:hypothetical protein